MGAWRRHPAARFSGQWRNSHHGMDQHSAQQRAGGAARAGEVGPGPTAAPPPLPPARSQPTAAEVSGQETRPWPADRMPCCLWGAWLQPESGAGWGRRRCSLSSRVTRAPCGAARQRRCRPCRHPAGLSSPCTGGRDVTEKCGTMAASWGAGSGCLGRRGGGRARQPAPLPPRPRAAQAGVPAAAAHCQCRAAAARLLLVGVEGLPLPAAMRGGPLARPLPGGRTLAVHVAFGTAPVVGLLGSKGYPVTFIYPPLTNEALDVAHHSAAGSRVRCTRWVGWRAATAAQRPRMARPDLPEPHSCPPGCVCVAGGLRATLPRPPQAAAAAPPPAPPPAPAARCGRPGSLLQPRSQGDQAILYESPKRESGGCRPQQPSIGHGRVRKGRKFKGAAARLACIDPHCAISRHRCAPTRGCERAPPASGAPPPKSRWQVPV